jgi:hypothetical protein
MSNKPHEVHPRVIKPEDYVGNPVYRALVSRLYRFTPPIRLEDHIQAMKDVGRTVSEGVTFLVKDGLSLRMALTAAKINGSRAFHWDDRKVWVHALAALATEGEGYREIGRPSLHIAVSKTICNVHLDEFGFVGIGPDGEEYLTPDLARHIIDELVWRAKIRPKVLKLLDATLPRALSVPAGQLLDHTYIVAPSMENRFNLRLGAGVKYKVGRRVDLRFEYTCGNSNCSDSTKTVTLAVDI